MRFLFTLGRMGDALARNLLVFKTDGSSLTICMVLGVPSRSMSMGDTPCPPWT
jgi:hypothetical protein